MHSHQPTIFVSLPVLDESENISAVLDNIRSQDFEGCIRVFVCVNQPDEWWADTDKVDICIDNQRSIELLSSEKRLDIEIIDRSSPGKGWQGRKHGVGYARREIMQAIAAVADSNDIIISLDADTAFNPGYFTSVVETINQNPECSALSVPYFHHLTGNPIADRAILRYEIYMRTYAINLLRIGSPYAFTALGSAIALTVNNYKSIGGITPKMSGEDFYFLQKLRKKGNVACWNQEKVFPAARFSDRVYFGTGPAMIKGAAGDWSSYPIYNHNWFDEIGETYRLFSSLYTDDLPTPMDDFISETFLEEKIWSTLRKHSRTEERFIRACHEKIDGLRILQYLKWKQRKNPLKDEDNLAWFLTCFFPDAADLSGFIFKSFDFAAAPIADLERIRNFLTKTEEVLQKRL